jgi:hypothetical protein
VYIPSTIREYLSSIEVNHGRPSGSRVAGSTTIRSKRVWSNSTRSRGREASGPFLTAWNRSLAYYRVTGTLTIRGIARPVTLEVHYLGQWQTPWWEDGVAKGPKTRAGFVAKTTINRHDFGISWNDTMDKGGIVVSDTVEITIDAEGP